MKTRLFILVIMVVSPFILAAQSGSWYVGGAVGFSSSTDKDPAGNKDVSSSWAFAPEVGTFLRDDIQLGLALGLSGTSDSNNGTDVQSTTSLTPTVYARKFFKITDNFSTFGGFYLSYLSGKTTTYTITPASESTQSGIGLRLGIGVAYALSPRFTAVGQYGLLGFQSVGSEVNGTDTGTSTSFDFGVNTIGYGPVGQSGGVFNIGIYYTFKQ